MLKSLEHREHREQRTGTKFATLTARTVRDESDVGLQLARADTQLAFALICDPITAAHFGPVVPLAHLKK